MSVDSMDVVDALQYDRPAEDVAEERGLVVIESDDWHLQLDVDEETTRKQHEAMSILEDRGLIGSQMSTTSQHGGRHRYIQLQRPLPLDVRAALQTALGSDPKRELLAVLRKLEHGRKPEMLLFETPSEALRITPWLELNPYRIRREEAAAALAREMAEEAI